MAAKPKKPPGGTERRSSPVFRARAQEAYEVLRGLIADHGGTDITDDLADKPTVEDVMRTKPEMVGALLRSAWQLRTHESLSDYFQSAEDPKTPVSEYEQLIGPCGRTYEDTVQSHLFGCARLYMKRLESEWLAEKLVDPKKLGKEFTGGFGNFLRKMVGMKPNVNEQALRDTYPSKGLYETLKPFLLDEAQFKLVSSYANLSTKGATIIGDIFENLRSTAAIKVACVLDPDTLMNARSCAVAYAETEIFAEATADEKDAGRKKNVNELRRDKELTQRVKKSLPMCSPIFSTIMLKALVLWNSIKPVRKILFGLWPPITKKKHGLCWPKKGRLRMSSIARQMFLNIWVRIVDTLTSRSQSLFLNCSIPISVEI